MADHPLAGAAYGVAALFGASPDARDIALAAGSVADTLMQGAAPLGAPVRGRPAPPQQQPAAKPFDATVRLRELNSAEQAMGANVMVTKPMLGTGTPVPRRIKPPGWQGNGRTYNEARGHLQAKQLGGMGEDRRNSVTLTQNPTNSSHMVRFENQVARMARAGEVVDYSVTPLYGEEAFPPAWVLMMRNGSRSGPAAQLIQNPAGRLR
jgi:hypothetical protein